MGVKSATVMPSSRIRWASSIGAQVVRPPRTTAEPLSSGAKICSSEVSKPSAPSCSTRSAGVSRKASAARETVRAIVRWLTGTPLGTPVVPEV